MPLPNIVVLKQKLDGYLMASVGAKRLRQLGWFDFHLESHAEVVDLGSLADVAFIYLSVDEDGNWNGAQDVAKAVVLFATQTAGYAADIHDLRDLKEILTRRPIDRKALSGWFDAICM